LSFPKRLRKAPIVEALCELRFKIPESELAELVVGKIAAWQLWTGMTGRGTGNMDVPEELARQDPNLRYLPKIEFRSEMAAGKIGGRVLSYHALAPYPGWENLQPRLQAAVGQLFATFPGILVERVGLRYVNLFGEANYGDVLVSDLAVDVSVAGEPIANRVNVNYSKSVGNCEVTVRIATKEFVQTTTSTPFTTLVDLDVYTVPTFTGESADVVLSWIEEAHELERSEFFRVLGDGLLQRMRED